jgi:hypothetical protein
MSGEVVIRCQARGSTLRLAPAGGDYFAELRAEGMTAQVRVDGFTLGGHGLTDFFDRLASLRRPWSAVEEFSSMEGELSIACRMDGRGEITMRVSLQHGPMWDWRTELELELDPAQLPRLAQEACEFEAGLFAKRLV